MKGPALTDGFRRAGRAWPMALMLAAFTFAPGPALALRDRMSAADVGLGGFPFNISGGEHYAHVLTPPQLWTLGLLFLIWVFLSGGVIDRLARDRRSSSSRFFAACGACFGPLVRLALLALLLYAAVLRWIAPPLASAGTTLDAVPRMALFGALALLLFLIALVFDYARIRLVIEDRRSAIGALLASLRLLRSHGAGMLAVQALFWLLLVLWISLRSLTGADLPWLTPLAVAGQVFLKLALAGAQASLYQTHLASAGWVARQDPAWPDDSTANPAAI